MPNNIILVTGASGFIGRALVKSLCEKGYCVRATVRSELSLIKMLDFQKQFCLQNLTLHNLGDLSDKTDWLPTLKSVGTIIHCAARAHILQETSDNPLETFRQINTRATEHLARMARSQGIKRFIFLSSIGVLGHTSNTTPFTDYSIPNPQAPYAQAKLEAEIALHNVAQSMDYIIIRPTIVYGPGVGGNFGKLLDLIKTGMPIPLGAIKNRRHFLGIDNLIDFILTCINFSEPIQETFILADKDILTTTALLKNMANITDKKIILIPVPQALLQWGLNLIGKSGMAAQLLGNLEIKSTKARLILNWTPPYAMHEQRLK